MIRTFEAPSLTEALERARAVAGPRAVVIDVARSAAGPGRRARVVLRVAAEPGADGLEQRLRGRGLSRARRRALLDGVAERPGPAAREALVRERVVALVPVAREVQPLPRVLAVVGPTGVGKTTTLAKLAGRAVVEAGLSVGFVTLDLYRVAAVEQLRVYADLIGAPLEVAGTAAELRRAVERLDARCDLVLVDTAGRSPSDSQRLAELAHQVQAAPNLSVLLVLAATTRLRELREAQARFAGCHPSGLILTKLDEAVTAGDALELMAELPFPVRLLAAGQEVPSDLLDATPERVASWVLGGEAA